MTDAIGYEEDCPREVSKNRNTLTIVPINLSALERFDNDAVVSVETLIEAGIVKNFRDEA